MITWLENAVVCTKENELTSAQVLIVDDKIAAFYEGLSTAEAKAKRKELSETYSDLHIVQANGKLLSLGFIDPHVHLRDPGFTYKEDLITGTAAAAAGGYTRVLAMPNVNPVPNSPELIQTMRRRAKEQAKIKVDFYSPVTDDEKGLNLVDFAAQMKAGAVAFSDDGKGMQNPALCREAMRRLVAVGGLLAQHCEENSLLNKGYINAGDYARKHGHRGISDSVEEVMTARDLILAAETGCRYHLCHMSTAKCADLLYLAKEKWQADVSAEITPHHLLLSDDDLREDGNFKMNPPLRSAADVAAMVEAIASGLVEIIATDHAPHALQEKNGGLATAAFGITGLETAFPLIYTDLVKSGRLKLATVLKCFTAGPAKRFGYGDYTLETGATADLVLVDLNAKWTIRAADQLSKGKNTPFDGREVYGKVTDLWCDGKQILSNEKLS